MPSTTDIKSLENCCHRLILTVVALVCAFIAGATLFKPTVTNYTSRQFDASNQNWACGQDGDGIMYFGNNDGLLVFDGARWKCYPVPGHYIVRSLMVDGNRVYTGSYQQFGYFSRDDFGEMRYTSISDSIDPALFNDDEIWKIERAGDYLIFQSFRSLFVYDGRHIEVCANVRPLFIYNVSGHIYAQLIDGDFAEFDPETRRLTTLIERELVGDDDIVGACDYEPGLVLLATESNGLFIYDTATDKLRPFATDYDDGIRHAQVNRMIVTPKRDIIIGTIQGGIYAMNQSGRPLWHYCLENGLNNNSVLGLLYDNFGNIWSALDYGISLIHTSLPFLILEPDHTDPYIGMTYAVSRFGDKIYMATNQGLYTYSIESGKISEVPRVKAQTWHVSKIDDQLFVGCNTSVDVLSSSGTEHYNSNATDIVKARLRNRDVLLESSYYLIYVYTRGEDGLWHRDHALKDFAEPVRQIETDYDGSVWCAHLASGVMRLELSDDLTRVKDTKHFKSTNSNNSNMAFVMKIRGRVAVSDGDKLYIYDTDSCKLKPYESFNRDLPMIKGILSTESVDDNLFWVTSKTQYNLISYEDGRFKRIFTVPLDLFSMQSNGLNNKVFVDKDLTAFFTLNNGIGTLSLTREAKEQQPLVLTHGSITSLSKDGNETRLPIDSKTRDVEVPGNIMFSLRYPNYNARPSQIRYELEGGGSRQSHVTSETEISYGGLTPGHYVFKATLIDDDRNESEPLLYEFTVPRPWYLTIWAMLLYFILIVLLVVLIAKWRVRRALIKEEHKNSIEQAAQSIKILEQERIIAQQQKQLLEIELTSKSKELASLALDMAQRQRVIDNLKDTISEQKRKGSITTNDIDSLLKHIDSDIGDSEFWNIYHNNFDLIHENFFRNLVASYPTLTPVDLRFCALLRLNLSTKDIAKFTSLTVRGVETARYRLRKKLGIKDKESLVQFLIDFKYSN